MTICIAAVCEDGKNIVVAADRMFTAGSPLNVEFEPRITKIQTLRDGCATMAAGNSLYADDVIRRIVSKVRNQPLGVRQICELGKEMYSEFRAEKFDETVVNPTFGADLTAFKAKGGFLPAYLQTQAGIYQQIVAQGNQFNINLDLIVAGIDATGCTIGSISHPGTLHFWDRLGYNAIGSGAVHAIIKFFLGGQTPQSRLEETLFSVCEAKRAAEVAPGVGQETEMAVISDGSIWLSPRGLLDSLAEISTQQAKKTKVDVAAVKKAYEQHRKEND